MNGVDHAVRQSRDRSRARYGGCAVPFAPSSPKASRFAVCALGFFGLLFAAALPARERIDPARTPRPSIWVSSADRDAILRKIDTQPWARSQFEALRTRTEAKAAEYRRDPAAYLRRLPWIESAAGTHPTLPRIDDNMASTGRAGLQSGVQDMLGHAIDCGVLYYLTEDRAYASVAADVLQALIQALRGLAPSTNVGNGGWIYVNDHLYEARALGAQIPILYDFVADYVSEPGVTVLDLATGRQIPFAREAAQEVFRTYTRLAVEHGMSNTNWPVLEMPSLTHNALALDDPEERARWLAYVTHLDAERQDPLEKIVHEFEQAGGVWPESIQYSSGVAANVTYIVALLRRQDPAIEMPRGFAGIPRSILRLRDFRFPNGEYVRFGDGPRRAGSPHRSLEIAYALAVREGDVRSQDEFGGVLREGLANGQLERGKLWAPLSGAEVYLGPLSLLWFAPEIDVPAVAAPALPVTDQLPFAGLVLQRNLPPDGDPESGFMAAVSGAAYVHSHASGMALELYGAGVVLGPNAGKGRYTTDEHENHRRLFAAANTVIVNGAARSAGGWVNLGIERVEPVAAEPGFGAKPVSPHHSFTVTRFRQEHGAAAPAPQERLVGIVRTSARSGFYVDVFRSRAADAAPGEFHDYLYRNLGEDLRLHRGDEPLGLAPAPDRFPPAEGGRWQRNRTYLYPGWHYFEQAHASAPVPDGVVAEFAAARLQPQPAGMRLHIVGETGRTYATALAPAVAEAPAGYGARPVPVLAARQSGEAWDRPFAVVYEPAREGASDRIVGVTALREAGLFAGFVVRARVGNEERIYHVLIPPEGSTGFRDDTLGLAFEGRYAVVATDGDGRALEMYVGDGVRLVHRRDSLRSADGSAFSAWVDLQGEPEVKAGRGRAIFEQKR